MSRTFSANFLLARLDSTSRGWYTTAMSGHSKWATIHRQKGVKDAARGQLFSKLAKLITIAAKNGVDPESNFKLREIIEKARDANMPKENIDRAINKVAEAGALEEVVYEGFGLGGVGLLISAMTDNRNRTGQEIKNILERNGGRLAGPGAVSFQFEKKGFILVEPTNDVDSQMLQLIDLGIEELDQIPTGVECFVEAAALYKEKQAIQNAGFVVLESEIISKPTGQVLEIDQSQKEKLQSLVDSLENHDDVDRVFTTVNL